MSAAVSSSKKRSTPKRLRRLAPETVMLIRQILFGTLLFLIISALVTGVWYGTRVDALTIDQVSVTGGETISHDAVAAAVTEVLQGTYFKLIPRQFSWLYPEQEVTTQIYAFERVKTATVERIGGKELHVHLTEFIPTALWCTDQQSSDCLFISDTGYAFTAAPSLSGGALVRYSTLGREPVRGEQLMEVSDLAAVSWFVTALRTELGWTTTYIEIDSVGDVFYVLSDRSELKTALAADPSEVFANLVTILESEDFTDMMPGEFQYIDLRFGNKVFVNREPWEGDDTIVATASLAWDEFTTATVSPAIATADIDEGAALAVPLIEEVDEVVVIEPVPEVSTGSEEVSDIAVDAVTLTGLATTTTTSASD